MRVSRIAQISIFETYAEHERAERLKSLDAILDDTPEMLEILNADLIDPSAKATGRCGLSVENILRCLLLKQQLQVSYEQLSFHLCDSMSYRAFARLPHSMTPKRSTLQATIRSIRPETIEKLHLILIEKWLGSGELKCDSLRVDSTVVESNIAPPSDSRLLDDSVRVLSRLLTKSKDITGIKIRFTDKRKASKSLAYRIFHAKKAEKDALYPMLLNIAHLVEKQADRALLKVSTEAKNIRKVQRWLKAVEHYLQLLRQVITQTHRRVIDNELVPVGEKIVSIFEPHTDIIVKGARDVQYGHKINLSTETKGFITYMNIEKGNPSDKELALPVLEAHRGNYSVLPSSFVGDGGYASRANVEQGREMGVDRVVFNKRVGLSYHEMGVKKKTFDKLARFRAGIEGNISELKRVYGASRALWKGLDGFQAFVWSSVLSYNLFRMSRMKLE